MKPPLAGRRILVTRAREQAPPLIRALTDLGAEAVAFPTIEIRPIPDTSHLDRAIGELNQYAWLGFTSANGVRTFAARLDALGVVLPQELRIAAVGPATAQALAERGARIDAMPTEFTGDHLARGLGEVRGTRILLPRASGGREALAVLLRAQGALVDDIPIYATVPAALTAEARAQLDRGVDAATFTSGSAVRHFADLTGGEHRRRLGDAIIACIGPFTAAAARAVGLTVHVEPLEHTVPGLVRALAGHYERATKAPVEART